MFVIFTFGAMMSSSQWRWRRSLLLLLSLSHIVVVNVLTELCSVQVFTSVVFEAVRCPMWHLHRPTTIQDKAPVLGLSHGAPLRWMLVPRAQCPLLIFLLFSLTSLFLLLLCLVTRPVSRTHQFFAFMWNVSVPVDLYVIALQRFHLVVHCGFLRSSCSLALFLPLSGPPNTNHDAEDPQDAEDHTQHRDQITWKRQVEDRLGDLGNKPKTDFKVCIVQIRWISQVSIEFVHRPYCTQFMKKRWVYLFGFRFLYKLMLQQPTIVQNTVKTNYFQTPVVHFHSLTVNFQHPEGTLWFRHILVHMQTSDGSENDLICNKHQRTSAIVSGVKNDVIWQLHHCSGWNPTVVRLLVYTRLVGWVM